MIEAGTSVEGYRVVRMIGRGGMGVVYEAVQTSLNRSVALKVLRPELAQDPGFVERFRREGRLQASIEHPNVLDVYEVGESEQGLFLSMRLVPGQTLLDLLRDGELDADRSLKLLDQVTGALDAAHEATLVHRDVKPQNVLVDDADQAYLADFGLTREGSETTAAASRTMLGSVAYVAPEIVRGEEPTPASDRYSLGATLYQCLTGDVVFPRGSDAAVLYAHAAEPPPGVHERRPELPEELDEVLAAALAKDPDTRPETAQSIIAAAREALGEDSKQFGPPPPVGPVDPGALSALPPPPGSGSASGGSGGSSRRGIKIAAVVGLLLAGVALVAAATMSSDDQDGGSDEVPVAAVASGGQALGSALAVPDRSVDCRGEPADAAANSKGAPSTLSCSIVQSELPGGELLVPADGAIVGWNVRGAEGDLALDVIRPRGSDTLRVNRSQWEYASNPGPNHYETLLAVEAGDQVGIELGPGASIGVSDVEGATTQRWFNPLGGAYGEPDRGPGTGLDGEIALRADFVPDEEVEPPRQLTGSAAANAPDGKVRDSAPLKVDSLDEPLTIELSEVGDDVVVDVVSEGRRTLRVFLADLVPLGIPVELKTVRYAGEPFGEVDVWWVNPNTGRSIFHFLALGKGHVEFAG